MSILDYLQQLQQQRNTFKKYPFLDRSFYFTNKNSYENIISEIIGDQYKYSGIKEIYLNEQFQIVAEFYSEFASSAVFENSNKNFINTKFLYIPVTKFDSRIYEVLPYTITYYSNNINNKIKIYPEEINLFEPNIYNFQYIYFYQNRFLTQKYFHPFLPNFIFTGRVTKPNKQDFLYEYKDEKGYYGLQNKLYLSDLKPYKNESNELIGLKYPFEYNINHLIEDNFYLKLFGNYPEIIDDNNIGSFTGFITNNIYSNKTYFLYQDVKDNLFLSLYKPIFKSINSLLLETNSDYLLENNTPYLLENELILSKLQQENGSYILQENGSYILIN